MTKTVTPEQVDQWLADNGLTRRQLTMNAAARQRFHTFVENLPDDPPFSAGETRTTLAEVERVVGRTEMDRAIQDIQRRGERLEDLFTDTRRHSD